MELRSKIRSGWHVWASRWFGSLALPSLVLTGSGLIGAEPSGIDLSAELPSAGPSIVRLLGALVLVVALVLGVFWLFRNGIRWVPKSSGTRKLKILEGRVVGHRQTLLVVGYEGERLLLGASPSGLTLLTRLPPSDPHSVAEGEGQAEPLSSFGDALRQVLTQRK